MNDKELQKAIDRLRKLDRYSNIFEGFSVHLHFLQEARKRLEKKVMYRLKRYKVK